MRKSILASSVALLLAIPLILPNSACALTKCASGGSALWKFKISKSCQGLNSGERITPVTGKIVLPVACGNGSKVVPFQGTCVSTKNSVRISGIAEGISPGCIPGMFHVEGTKANRSTGHFSNAPFDTSFELTLTPVTCSTVPKSIEEIEALELPSESGESFGVRY